MTTQLAYRSGMEANNLNALLLDWLETVSVQLTKKTIPQYKTFMQKFFFGAQIKSIENLTYHTVQSYINSFASTDLSPSTVHNHHAAISNFCKYLVDRGLLEYNPCCRVRLPVISKEPPRYLTEEQEERLLVYAMWHGIYFETLAALRTAMRESELRRMRWEDISFEQNTITIYNTKNPKKRKFRIIPLHAELKKIFWVVRKDAGYVWANRKGQIYSTGHWDQLLIPLKPYFPEVESLGLQICRSTCATRMVTRGVPLEIVSKILGHTNLQTTIDHYAYLQQENLQKGIEVL